MTNLPTKEDVRAVALRFFFDPTIRRTPLFYSTNFEFDSDGNPIIEDIDLSLEYGCDVYFKIKDREEYAKVYIRKNFAKPVSFVVIYWPKMIFRLHISFLNDWLSVEDFTDMTGIIPSEIQIIGRYRHIWFSPLEKSVGRFNLLLKEFNQSLVPYENKLIPFLRQENVRGDIEIQFKFSKIGLASPAIFVDNQKNLNKLNLGVRFLFYCRDCHD